MGDNRVVHLVDDEEAIANPQDSCFPGQASRLSLTAQGSNSETRQGCDAWVRPT
jgi:hypothetical protein